MLERLLAELGLNDKEISVYLSLVRRGRLGVIQIAKESRLNRTTVYDVLEKLLDKELVKKEIAGAKVLFIPTSPNNLIEKVKEKEALAHLAVSKIREIRTTREEDTAVDIFEGIPGLKAYFREVKALLMDGQLSYYYVYNASLESASLINYFLQANILDVRGKVEKIDFRIIWNPCVKSNAILNVVGRLAASKKLPARTPGGATVVTFDDHVAYFLRDTAPKVILMKNKGAAMSQRLLFTEAWSAL